ncbi:MAG: universal stress protein [Armatimonadetes bacterium]|nr:universal stress protein [Armatimonadota bacterium]
MFDHLLIPLDGSRLAESVLPAAGAVARRFGSGVTLLHVVERTPPDEVHGEPHLTTVAEAEAYLTEVASREFPSVAVTMHVHGPDETGVAESIARHADELRAALIVLCTHGQGGARELIYGSVAQQVLSHGSAPVLLIRPGPGAQVFACSRVLVPLDGSVPSEASLPLAEALAHAFGGRLHLLTVVPTVATVSSARAPAALFLPIATAVALDLEEQETLLYLDGLAARLRQDTLTAEVEVGRGDPAWEVAAAAERLDADLVVMATHGRSGMSAVWAGSVAIRIMARCRRPMLLVRAPGAPDGL